MPGGVKQVIFTIASAGTQTNGQYVGNHARAFLVVSNMTNYNAGVGNATINLLGAVEGSGVYSAIPSATVATHISHGCYVMPNPGMPWLKVQFGTAVTGTGANTIDLIVGDDS